MNNSEMLMKYVQKIAFDREKLFKKCTWIGNDFDCKRFKSVFTETGQCFTFNSLNTRSIYTDMYEFSGFSLSIQKKMKKSNQN